MQGTLIAHCGTSKVTRNELKTIPVPSGTNTFKPIPHHEVVEALVTAERAKAVASGSVVVLPGAERRDPEGGPEVAELIGRVADLERLVRDQAERFCRLDDPFDVGRGLVHTRKDVDLLI